MSRIDKLLTNRGQIDAIICGSEICRIAVAVGNRPYVLKGGDNGAL